MVVSEIQNIQKKDTKIYYLENYSAIALYVLFGEEKSGKIEFSIEYKPHGEPDIKIILIDKVDYPLLKVTMELKTLIKDLISKEQLP